MAGTKLVPEKITSPFQLMAAWFSMLVLLVTVLLTAAANIGSPSWAAGYLVIFSSLVTLAVIGCVTLMLTTFRPHLQDGKEYASWLKDRNTYSAGVVRIESKSETVQRKPIPRPANRRPTKKNFLVEVTRAPDANLVVQALIDEGFVARTYDAFDEAEPLDLERHEAIWIGYEVPAKEAIRAIKIAVTYWPHLKYMQLSNDGASPPEEVHRELYIGGSSSTAEKYGLVPWERDEILGLDEGLSTADFQRLIRNKIR